MSIRRSLALTTFAALALPAAAQAAPSCAKHGSKTVAANSQARVYTRSAGSRLYGCLRATGRTKLLVDPGDGFEISYGFDKVTLAGHVVGYAEHVTDVSCKAMCPPDYDPNSDFVVTDDLKTRRTRSIRADASALAVNASGWLAWLQPAGEQSELHLSKTGSSNALVDTGALDRLSFSGKQLLWRKDGQGVWIDG